MDYDNDGDIDVLSGSYTGEIYLFECGKDGELAQGRFLLASDGTVLKGGTSITPEARDIDNDGDLDLVIGTRTSGVFTIENIGTRAQPAWSTTTKRLLTADGKKIKGSNAHHADWDGDGVDDLVLGSEWGDVVWHKNTGSNSQPTYGAAKTLVDIRSQRSGSLNEGDTPKHPGSRTKVHVTDWNGDGQADLLVGDVRWAYYMLDPLTPEQRSEKHAVKPLYDEGRKAQTELMNERNAIVRARKPIPEELNKRIKAQRAKYAAVNKQWRSYNRKRSNTHGWVWLYLRDGKAKTLGSAKPAAMSDGPIALAATLTPCNTEKLYEVRAAVTADAGWHFYASVPATSNYPVTTPKVTLPPGVEQVTKWTTSAKAVPATDLSGTTWYEGTVVFTCKVRSKKALAGPLAVSVDLQVCDEQVCMPPTQLKVDVKQ